jgi:hypothetical protein
MSATASGDQRIAGLCSAMPRILVAKEIFHIQGAALAFVQWLDALVYLNAKRLELFDMREQFSADLFLIGVREPGNLRDGLFEGSNHKPRLVARFIQIAG